MDERALGVNFISQRSIYWPARQLTRSKLSVYGARARMNGISNDYRQLAVVVLSALVSRR